MTEIDKILNDWGNSEVQKIREIQREKEYKEWLENQLKEKLKEKSK